MDPAVASSVWLGPSRNGLGSGFLHWKILLWFFTGGSRIGQKGNSKKKKNNNNNNNHADNNNRFFVHFALAMCCYTAVWGATHDGHEAGCDNWSFPFQWRYHNSWVEDLGVSVLGHLQVVFSIQSQSVPYPEIGKKNWTCTSWGKRVAEQHEWFPKNIYVEVCVHISYTIPYNHIQMHIFN